MGPIGYVVERADSTSGGRWHLVCVFGHWPNRALVRKFQTRRAAAAAAAIARAGSCDASADLRADADTIIGDDRAKWRKHPNAGDSTKLALGDFVLLLDRLGVPRPDWQVLRQIEDRDSRIPDRRPV